MNESEYHQLIDNLFINIEEALDEKFGAEFYSFFNGASGKQAGVEVDLNIMQ